MICNNCEQIGKKAVENFTQSERIFILTSAASMMKHIMANVNAPSNDKLVGNSVTTKMLLSFPPDIRERLLKQLNESTGFRVSLGNCPHGVEVLQ